MHFTLINRFKSQSFQIFLSGSIYQICIAISGILMPHLIITHYGSVLNGLISTVSQIVAYLSIVEMGIASASLVALYEPMAKHEYDRASQVVSAIKVFYHQIAKLFLLGSILCGLILPLIIKDDISVCTIWLVVVAVSGINLVTYIFLGKNRAVLQSDNKVYIINYTRCIGVVLQVALGVLVIFLDLNIAFIKLIAVFTCGIEAILLGFYVKKKYPSIRANGKPMLGAIKQRKDILIHQLSGLVLNNTDILLLSLIGSTLSLVSIYSVFNMVMIMLLQVISNFLSTRITIFAKLFVLGKINELKRKVSIFDGWYLAFSFSLFTTMAILIMPFIRLYTVGVNDANYDIPVVGLLFSVLGVSRVLRSCYSEIVASAGKFKETKDIVIITAIINLIISFCLIWKLEIAGLLIGSIIAELYRTIRYLIFFQKNIYQFNINLYAIRIITFSLLFVTFYWITNGYRMKAYSSYANAIINMGVVSFIVIPAFMFVNILINTILVDSK